jgi:spore coat polysaccharide biosynthesis predicted glycosyltransferase SpsG
MRGLALAQELESEGARAVLATATPDAPGARLWREEGLDVHAVPGDPAASLAPHAQRLGTSWVVLDGPGLGVLGGGLCRAGLRVMTLDDIGTGRVEAHTVLNPNVGAEERCRYELSPGTVVLAGAAFALIRRDVRRHREAPGPHRTRLLVAFGGQDADDHAGAALRALLAADVHLPGTVLVTAGDEALRAAQKAGEGRFDVRGPTDLATVLPGVGVALCAAGVTALELAQAGVALVLVPVAEDQRPGARALADAGAALLAGGLDEAAALVRQLERDVPRRVALAGRAFEMVDGRGVERVAAHLAAVAPATEEAS